MTKAPNARSQTNHDSSIWRDGPGGTWYMLSGGCTYKDGNKPEGACSGTGQLWNSTDLVTFTYMHAITPGGPGGYWELPYLLPFNADGSAIDNYHHNGAAVYALLFGHGNAYYVGGYNDTTKSFLPLDAVSLSFASWNRSTLTEIYLCHACSCQELLFSSWNRSTLTEIYLCHACSCQELLFSSWNRSTLTEIYLCHAYSCHEILRTETAEQVPAPPPPPPSPPPPSFAPGTLLANWSLANASGALSGGVRGAPAAIIAGALPSGVGTVFYPGSYMSVPHFPALDQPAGFTVSLMLQLHAAAKAKNAQAKVLAKQDLSWGEPGVSILESVHID
jgi:hypothetical protein